MSGSNKLESVDYRLKNLTNALYLTETDDVALRTGIDGNIIIEGNVNIPGTITVESSPEFPVHVHLTELGTYGNLKLFMPIDGSVTVNNFPTSTTITSGNLSVYSGNIGIYGNIAGITSMPSINIATMPEVEIKNDSGNPIPISANTSVNSVTNPIYVSTAGGSSQGKLWFFQIAQGLIPGHIPVFKSGYNPSIANNTEESIWGHSVIYPWANWNSGGTLSCTSTSASDTGILHITGLRTSDWTQVTELVTMTGTTPVVTTNSFIRINSAFYNGSTSTNVGEIDINRNGSTVGYITAGEGNSQSAQYTVPAGYTAYILTGQANIGKGNDGTGKFKYRLYGGSFQTAMTFLLFQSTFNYEFQTPLQLPEKTDLDVTLKASVSGTAATCAYSLILIAN